MSKVQKTAPIGHNSISGERIRAFVEKVENLQDSMSLIAKDVKDVYAEAKGTGFDSKIIRKIVALRKKSAEAVREEAELLNLYASAAQYDLGV